MPATVTLRAVAVWFLVGLFVGAGWATGTWIITRLLMRVG